MVPEKKTRLAFVIVTTFNNIKHINLFGLYGDTRKPQIKNK